MSPQTRTQLEAEYDEWARKYLKSLPMEHFMEAVPQATQRSITVASLELVAARRPDVHCFSELLVQYPRDGYRKPGQVVPDNMVVLYEGDLTANTNYNVATQPARPFWTLEYVSKSSERKDYVESLEKYERELRVPCYLVFYPDTQDLTLFRLKGHEYASQPPGPEGRYPIPELELEVAILDGWVRYWFRGELLPLPAELQGELDAARIRIAEQQRQLADQARLIADLQAQLAALRTPPGTS